MSQMFISQGSSLGIRYHKGTPMEGEERFPTGLETSRSCGLWHQFRGESVAIGCSCTFPGPQEPCGSNPGKKLGKTG